MKAWNPVQRLVLLTSVTALVMVAVWIASTLVERDSGTGNALGLAGGVATLATVGFAWALATAVRDARRSRT